jgi:nucleoside-diphosphate-sugar epimerase
MRVLVTGARGFIGRVLSSRLLAEGLDGQAVTQLVAADLSLAGLPQDDRLRGIEGSIAEPEVLQRALAEPVDGVFHLASLPGGASERDPDLGRRINLEATLALIDRLRAQANVARLVYASTVAVYGESLPQVVDEATPVAPAMTYGAHKLASEILIADASRRGWIAGLSLRLPGVVARPGDGAGLVSAFMSRLLWQLRAGEPVQLPVTADGTAWWISVQACVDNLLQAAKMDPQAAGSRRVLQMPALWLSMRQVIDAAAQVWGADRPALVSHALQLQVQRLFASYPPLHTPLAESLGLRHDGSAQALLLRATQPH